MTDHRSTAPTDSRMTTLLSGLFEDLENQHIMFCVLRGYLDLPYEVGHDLDMLTNCDDIRVIHQLILSLCRKQRWALVRYVTRAHYHAWYLVDHDSNGFQSLHIDIWTRIGWRGMDYVDNNHILKCRRRYRGIPVASSGCEAAVSLLKELLQCGRVKDKGEGRTKRRIQQLVEEDPDDFVATLAPTFGAILAAELLQAAVDGDWARIEQQTSTLRLELIRRRGLRSPFSLAKDWFSFGLGHAREQIRRDGLMLCFAGPDGCGKSTVADVVCDKVGPLYRGQHRFHARPGVLPPAGYALTRLKNLFGSAAEYRPPTDESYKPPAHRGPAVSAALLGYYTLDYALSHPRLLYQQAKGDLTLADRYFYDYIVGSETTFGIPEVIPRLLMRLLPNSDLTFFLEADPQRIYQRKPELTVREIERQNQAFRRLATWDHRIVTIDANQPLDVVVDHILDRILKQVSIYQPETC